MKNVLSKSILFGVLASTIFVVNCQKAPERKSSTNPDAQAKTADAKIGTCTAKINELVAALATKGGELEKKIKELDKPGTSLDAAQKEALNKLMEEAAAASKAVVDEIAKITVGADKAEGCNVMDDKDPKKVKTIVKIAKLNQRIADYRNNVNRLVTGGAIQGPTDTKQEPGPVVANPLLDNTKVVQGQTLEISKPLGEAFDKTRSAERIFMLSGRIVSDRDEKESMTKMETDKASSFCRVAVPNEKLEDKAKLKVLSLGKEAAKVEEKGSIITVSLEKTGTTYALECFIKKDAVVETELKDILRDNVKAVAAQ